MATLSKTWTTGLILSFSMGLGGCNTMQGVGQDLAAGGHALSTAATNTQESFSAKHKRVKKTTVTTTTQTQSN